MRWGNLGRGDAKVWFIIIWRLSMAGGALRGNRFLDAYDSWLIDERIGSGLDWGFDLRGLW